MSKSPKLSSTLFAMSILLSACGGGGGGATTTNSPPVATDDAVQTLEETAANFALVGNDTDADGNMLSVTAVSTPSHGTTAVVAGAVLYTPAADYEGTDTFTYTVSDGTGQTDTGTVTVTVQKYDRVAFIVDSAGTRHAFLAATTAPGTTLDQLTPNALPIVTQTNCGQALTGSVGSVGEGLIYPSSADADLYYVALDQPGVTTKLADNVVAPFALNCVVTSDRSKLFWIADEGGGQVSLKMAAWGDPSGATTLKGPWTTSGLTNNNLLGAPGANPTYIVFSGDADATDTIEVWRLRISDGQLTKLNPAFGVGQGLATSAIPPTRFNPAADQLYYLADQDIDQRFEVYRVALASPGVTTKVNSALQVNGDVTRFAVSTTTGFIGIIADDVSDDVFHAFAVSPSNLGTMNDVTPTLVAGGDAQSSFTTAFGQMFFLADATVDGDNDLYHTDLNAGFNVAQRVNPAVVSGGDAFYAQLWALASTRFYYKAAQDTVGVSEIYTTTLGVYGASVKLNDPLPVGDSVGIDRYLDTNTVVYGADQDGDGFHEVWLVPLDRSAAPIQLSDEVAASATIVNLLSFP